jgi:chromosome segregation ATPase
MNDEGESSIAAVAQRIHERANQVASERASVQVHKAELAELQALLQQEQAKTNATRRTMLSTVRERHGVEMELFQIQDLLQERLDKLQEYEQETDQLQQEQARVSDEWEEETLQDYVEQHLQREFYKRSVQGRIQQRQECIQERNDKLHQLQQEQASFQRETNIMAQETKRLEAKIVEMDSGEEKQDEQVAALSMQIQATIQKRSALRKTLREAQEACQKANREMREWEQKRLDLSNRY